jgi:hypothetical protein
MFPPASAAAPLYAVWTVGAQGEGFRLEGLRMAVLTPEGTRSPAPSDTLVPAAVALAITGTLVAAVLASTRAGRAPRRPPR